MSDPKRESHVAAVSEVLDPEGVARYVAARSHLARVVGTVIEVETFGEGKINAVFGVRGDRGSLVLKQALPWIRVLPNWALTVHRVEREAWFLESWADFNAAHVPKSYGYDDGAHTLAMEELTGYELWRTALHEGRVSAAAATGAGTMVARSAFHTSPFGRDAEAHARDVARSANPAMDQMMQDVVFDIPFTVDARNSTDPQLTRWREKVRADEAVLTRVAELRWCYGTRREALLHGDLHTGSVMVAGDQVRVIDGEFARYGPVAWDLGELWAHLVLARRSLDVRRPGESAPDLVSATWAGFTDELRAHWPERRAASLTDGWLEAWLEETRTLAVRFAGLELLRRMIGVGACEQLTMLEPDAREAVADDVLALAVHALKEGQWT
ncbi:phosphotransferase [Micromonospora inyonensis]|uniref:5'-methylthioribose kinase n=1 Tax=Micromonospora inyonensis TaxID=47866 RepID=A0A1C6RK99_9ACTN|nr:phosphotransferase [Micromonospora inyonensis]SCL17435.1 5'-methylthioribose kinase [Micromonospora inyonensis]